MDEVGIPKKLIGLTKMCMENTRYQVWVENIMSEVFEVDWFETGWRTVSNVIKFGVGKNN